MEPTQAADPNLLAHFEGLVHATSRKLKLNSNEKWKPVKRYDVEELQQILRVKVWKALLAFEPQRYPRQRRLKAMESYVYGCIANEVKDLLKRDREPLPLIEDIALAESPMSDPESASDRFEFRYMGTEDDAFDEVERDSAPLVPNTLSLDERSVLALKYLGYTGPEMAERLGMTRSQVAAAIKDIREKMEDWRPKSAVAPTPPERDLSPAPVA